MYLVSNVGQDGDEESYQCTNSLIFIEKSRLCDNEMDCPNNDDENNETCISECFLSVSIQKCTTHRLDVSSLFGKAVMK